MLQTLGTLASGPIFLKALSRLPDSQALLNALNSLEPQAENIAVPWSYADKLQGLRGNIGLVRRKLRRQ